MCIRDREQKDLIVSVYAGADGSFTLYEDNGVTYDYEKGNYATIPFVYDDEMCIRDRI